MLRLYALRTIYLRADKMRIGLSNGLLACGPFDANQLAECLDTTRLERFDCRRAALQMLGHGLDRKLLFEPHTNHRLLIGG